MPFSHHSHSGTFCPGHAQDSLEDIVKTAIDKNFQVFALTEHMPRHDQDRYPEEIEVGSTLQSLIENETRYVQEAQRLRKQYGHTLSMPIGFESDWCGPHSLELIHNSLSSHPYDFFIGSIHHVHGIPIDYDDTFYEQARDLAGGVDEKLFSMYFDEQLEMLQALRPPVVGHLDLIRLKSNSPNIDWRSIPEVWSRILRNLDFVASYGGILEINTAALRKGMDEPYPKSEICQEFLQRNGRFCLSDDSHGVAHVATNYHRILDFLSLTKIDRLYYLSYDLMCQQPEDSRFPFTSIDSISVQTLLDHKALV